MSLATRCFNCGTVFRVVQDQLKVSEGWVRCGQCDEIFNALETLFDLERDNPPEWSPPQHTADDMPSRLGGPVDLELPVDSDEAAASHEHVDVPIDTAPDAHPSPMQSNTWEAAPEPHQAVPLEAPADPLVDEEPFDVSFDVPSDARSDAIHDTPVDTAHHALAASSSEPIAVIPAPAEYARAADSLEHIDVSPISRPHHEASSTPAERIDARDRLEFPDARFDPESISSEPMRPLHDTTLDPDSEQDASTTAPEFVLDARKRARWSGRGMRIGLSLASLALLVMLALQVGDHFRDTIAARWPGAQPLLASWCDAIGCTLQAPKHIDDVAVESTSLTRADGADAFKLAVTLRNHGAYALALPSVDLSLTDASGQLVARKVLGPKDWRVTTNTTLPPNAELPLQMLLAADSGRVTGYTVEVFYP